MQDQQPKNLKRRGFLFAAGVGSAGAVAVVVAGKDVAKPLTIVSAEDKIGNYEETPHISNYYRTARV